MARIRKRPLSGNIEDRRNEGREHPLSLANRNKRRLEEAKAEFRSQQRKPAPGKKKK